MVNVSKSSEKDLLNSRICDLEVDFGTSQVYRACQQLNDELAQKNFIFKPHFWLSAEWFSPDGIPGIAVPFYLAHPKLTKLEKKMLLEAEGSSYKECMQILRHEAGHAIDSAFNLHRKRGWRDTFGSFHQEYPSWYQPKPSSRNFVVHLKGWYAQAHPAEDFAETFAVWLNPTSRWKQRYKDWPALKKLEYVDGLMKSIANTKPTITNKKVLEPLSSLKETLDEYYKNKQASYSNEAPGFYDLDLKRIFKESNRPLALNSDKSAAKFIRENRTELRELIVRWTGTPAYSVDQLLQDLIDRCKKLKLELNLNKTETKTNLTVMLAVQTMNVIHKGKYKFAL